MATRKAAKPKKPPKPKPPPKFHEQAGAGSVGKAQAVGSSAGLSSAGSAPSSVLELVASELVGTAGLSAVVLELAGEGKLSIGAALSAWQHEQERVSNRVWRRPGGLARMGGL